MVRLHKEAFFADPLLCSHFLLHDSLFCSPKCLKIRKGVEIHFHLHEVQQLVFCELFKTWSLRLKDSNYQNLVRAALPSSHPAPK